MSERLPEPTGGKRAVQYLLGFPWCNPQGGVAPPGTTVGVTAGGAALYRLAPGLDQIPYAADAAAAERRAAQLARREVGVDDPRWIDHPTRIGAELLDASGYRYAPIEGPSMGLAQFLAHASLLIGEPVPVDLAATGALGPDGAVLPVDGLSDKVEFVGKIAVAVRRMLVPRGVWAPDHPHVRVIEVDDVRAALDEAFPDLEARVRERWASRPVEAALAAHRLYRVAAHGAMPGWEGVLRRARWLRGVVPAGSTAADHAARAEDIALRHTQIDGPSPAWPEDLVRAEPMRPFRVRLVAHLVQAAADADDALATEYAERGRAHVRPLEERTAEDAMLLGAVGRALAAAGSLGPAAEALDDALRTWEALEDEAQASYALCERLRIAGVMGDAPAVAAREALAAAVRAHPASDALTDGYVRLALARASVDTGAPQPALALVEGGPAWDELPLHLRAARARCLARACTELGYGVQAARVRAEIAHEPWRTLARLDAHLAEGGDGAALLPDLSRDPTAGREVRRVLARCPAGEPPGAFLARHFRY